MVSKLNSRLRGLVWIPGWVNVLCYWERLFSLTVSLSNKEYKWVLANCQESLMKCWGGGGGGVCAGPTSHPGGSSNTPSHFMLRKLG